MTRLTITFNIDAAELYTQRLLLCYLDQFDVAGSPISGLINLTDAIADALADNGNTRALFKGSAGEDKRGTKLINELQQNLNAVGAK